MLSLALKDKSRPARRDRTSLILLYVAVVKSTFRVITRRLEGIAGQDSSDAHQAGDSPRLSVTAQAESSGTIHNSSLRSAPKFGSVYREVIDLYEGREPLELTPYALVRHADTAAVYVSFRTLGQTLASVPNLANNRH